MRGTLPRVPLDYEWRKLCETGAPVTAPASADSFIHPIMTFRQAPTLDARCKIVMSVQSFLRVLVMVLPAVHGRATAIPLPSRRWSPSCCRSDDKEGTVLYYALVFLIVGLIASALGAYGVAAVASQIAWVLFVIGIVLLIVHIVSTRRRVL